VYVSVLKGKCVIFF